VFSSEVVRVFNNTYTLNYSVTVHNRYNLLAVIYSS